MTEKMKNSCDRLKNEINHIEDHLSQVSNQVKSAAETELKILDANLDNARQKLEVKQEQASDAVQRIKEIIKDKKNDVITKVEDWKLDHDIEKIEKQADKKEQQAMDAIMLAALSCVEAEVAIADALKARKLAMEVAG